MMTKDTENDDNDDNRPLLDPSLLEGLTDEQRQEALAAAAAAKRAEERAEQRALERAMQQKLEERQRRDRQEREVIMKSMQQETNDYPGNNNNNNNKHPHHHNAMADTSGEKVVFVPKQKRQQLKLQQQLQLQPLARDGRHNGDQGGEVKQKTTHSTNSQHEKQSQRHPPSTTGTTTHARSSHPPPYRTSSSASTEFTSNTSHPSSAYWTEKERQVVKQTYLGKSSGDALEEDSKEKNKRLKKSNKKITFRFEWDNTDDTLDDSDPLYAPTTAGHSNNHPQHSNQAHRTNRSQPTAHSGSARQHHHQHQQQPAFGSSNHRLGPKRKRGLEDRLDGYESSFQTKPIEKMTARDWRIFRENYEIVVRGGRAPPPLRSFREPCPGLPPLNPALLEAIENVMMYREPTPIQRQAIPIGLQRRDLIGIAETGSGKTAAFGVPLLHYLLQLPVPILNRVADQGPLALVVAPTRELALQIHGEFQKLLSRQNIIRTCAIVGGQSIQQQAQQLRQGVHVVVGTPGRMNDCIETAYMVLNQCCYIVLDEADRMIDMGFAPQMESILDAMGGLLKSENENEAYQQEEEDLKNLGQALPRHRVTAMFSATMPMEVEQIAKRYLRHPAVISIGDQDTSKNARIVQRIVFLSSPSQKETTLKKLLQDQRFVREKVIVFVNEKKQADMVGRMVERFGRPCVVLHGGKSQEQREENLAAFRQGGVVLVATDVAGRGLDIPNVAHVINYDLPTRSIDSYSHRIGRTGRAGKEGLATSLMTDEDEGIMAPLKAYLESTGNPVPDRLARHPAANSTTQGNVIH